MKQKNEKKRLDVRVHQQHGVISERGRQRKMTFYGNNWIKGRVRAIFSNETLEGTSCINLCCTAGVDKSTSYNAF